MSSLDSDGNAASKLRVGVFGLGLVVLAIGGVKLGGALSGAPREATAVPSAGPMPKPVTAAGANVRSDPLLPSTVSMVAPSASAASDPNLTTTKSPTATKSPTTKSPTTTKIGAPKQKPNRAPDSDLPTDFGGRR